MRKIWSLQRSKQTNDGLTLTELLVTLAVLAIIAALAFPILMDITNASRNSALDRQREVVADFLDQYGSGSFANAEGTGPDAGYRVGFPDYDNDGIQDANEPTVAKIGLDEYDEYILWQEELNTPVPMPLLISYPSTSLINTPTSTPTVVLTPNVSGDQFDGDTVEPRFYVNAGETLDGLSVDEYTGEVSTWIHDSQWALPATFATGNDNSSCAITTSQTVFCWGVISPLVSADDGVGYNSDTQPRLVEGLSGVVDLSAGGDSYCAVKSNGTVECWGGSIYGQLGYTTTDYRFHTAVPGITTATDISSIDANSHCAVLANGTIKCWGYGGSGQLGNGANATSATPVTVSGITNAVDVDGGFSHSCALLANGTVECWGYGWDNTPTPVPDISTATQISVGQHFGCALLADTTVRCWGNNNLGQLGDGTTNYSDEPVQPVGLTNVAQLADTMRGMCARLTSGIVKCWGDNTIGDSSMPMTTATSSNALVPTTAVSGSDTFTSIGSGKNGILGVKADRSVWGFGDKGLDWSSTLGPLVLDDAPLEAYARIWRTGLTHPDTVLTFTIDAKTPSYTLIDSWIVSITLRG